MIDTEGTAQKHLLPHVSLTSKVSDLINGFTSTVVVTELKGTVISSDIYSDGEQLSREL